MYNLEQLEKEVWILQGKINDLKQNPVSINEYQDRLNFLEFQLHHMQEEIQKMRQVSLEPDIGGLRRVMRDTYAPNKLSGLVPPLMPEQRQGDIQRNIPLPPIKPKKKDLEKTIGTGIMGIIASVLIFISLIIFGTLLIPYLSEGMMVFLMFIVSFAVSGAGYYLLQKNYKNKFYLSLCACGVTAIAISLFVTYIAFGFLNDIVFLFLMSVWMALMAFLCRKYNYLFRIIGEIGIFIVCIYGQINILVSQSVFAYYCLVAVAGLSALVFHCSNPRQKYEQRMFSNIMRTLNIYFFCLPVARLASFELGTYYIDLTSLYFMLIAFLALVAIEMVIVWNERVENGIVFYIASTIQMLTACYLVGKVLLIEPYVFIMISSIFLLYLFSRKQTRNPFIGDICVIFLYLLGGFNFLGNYDFGGLLCSIPLLLFGSLKYRKLFLYGGILGIASNFFMVQEFTFVSLLLGILLPFVLFLILARLEEDDIFKGVGYLWFLFCFAGGLFSCLENTFLLYSEISTLSFLLLAIPHMFIVKMNILKAEGKIFDMFASVITAIMMIASMSMMYNDCMVLLVILVAIGLFVMNSKKLLEKSQYWGYYIALKYTILMLVILNVVWDISIVYSISMLLFSLASILLGFLYKNKSFRIYGLVLSMISVFKLVLFDVDAKSTAYNAIGFLICGLICFGISFIYNKIEQKINKK